MSAKQPEKYLLSDKQPEKFIYVCDQCHAVFATNDHRAVSCARCPGRLHFQGIYTIEAFRQKFGITTEKDSSL